MATESNQTAGATGPAAPPAAPARNRHSAGIQVDGLGLPTHIPAGNVFVVSPSEAAIRTFQATLVYGHIEDAVSDLLPPRPCWLRQPILTVKGDDGVTWDWRGMRDGA